MDEYLQSCEFRTQVSKRTFYNKEKKKTVNLLINSK